MIKEVIRLKANFKGLNGLKYLVTESINDLPKLMLEHYSIFFKKMYADDTLKLINIHRSRFGAKEFSKETFSAAIDSKFNRFEKDLKKFHDKVSTRVSKYKSFQQTKRMGLEAIIVFIL